MVKLNKETLQDVLTVLGYKVSPEYKFSPERRFKADWLVSLSNGKNVLIEYEGIMSSKCRHTSVTGYSKDCEKYNLAATLGFIVLRYTVMNFDNVITDLEILSESTL
jgi:hypothetical protein